MIHSMTAFARQESQGEWGALVWEIRSINHRYFECSCKLPDAFTELEHSLREGVKQRLQRGKIDIALRIKADNTGINRIQFNEALLNQLIDLNQHVKQNIGEGAYTNTMNLLSWPNVIQQAEINWQDFSNEVMAAFAKALEQVVAMRQREGAALVDFIEQRLQAIEQELQQITEHLPEVIRNQRIRLQTKLAEVVANFDPQRLEQELVLLAQRMDVEEELNRLANHVGEVKRTLTEGGPQGRRLDFLMQELNREANTLGAKAGDVAISNIAISLKVLIEQMREQVQNIE